MVSSGATQRRGKLPQSSTSMEVPDAPMVATVRRRKFGTSPFDEHWLNVDCCGLFCAGLTYCLHLYGCYAVCFILLPPWMSHVDEDTQNRKMSLWGYIHSVLFCLVAWLAVVAHFKAMTTDPGAVPPDAKPLEEEQQLLGANASGSKNGATAGTKNGLTAEEGEGETPKASSLPRAMRRQCRRCHAYKPMRAHHCSVCKRCIIKMDHHCPWVNNCVGIGNHKYFLLFVFYTCISCLYSMVLLLWRFFICMNNFQPRKRRQTLFISTVAQAANYAAKRKNIHCLDEPSHLLNIMGLVIECILFGLFTACMIIDQWDVVNSNLTHIDRLKSARGGPPSLLLSPDDSSNSPGGRGLSGWGEVFGEQKSRRIFCFIRSAVLDWLSPFAKVCFPPSVRDEILGYCRSCNSGTSNPFDQDTELGNVGSNIEPLVEMKMARSTATVL